MLGVTFPTNHEIRRQISLYGSLNKLRSINEQILTSLLGRECKVCYFRFVPSKHLMANNYKQAKLCFDAATHSLATVKGYVDRNDDKLLSLYWDHFIKFAEFGNDLDMDICKDILSFVKNVEYKQLRLSNFTYEELFNIAKYKTIDDYPMDYIMRFDGINEYDRYIPKEDKLKYELEYAEMYLSNTQYSYGNGLAAKLMKAIIFQAEWMFENHVAEDYLDAYMKPSKEMLGKISDTRCAVGSKRVDFWEYLAKGVTLELSPVINKHIDVLNYMYELDIDYPRINNTDGMQLWEYLPMLIIQEDPKKRRTAYKSNPILDAIGDIGMAADKIMFSVFPNILCGRKRDTNEDIILDRSRYASIEKVYETSKQLGIGQVSTDLTACTENLNMIDYREIVFRRLVLLNELCGMKYNVLELERRLNMVCNILFETGLTLSEDETHTIWYMRKGQMAGLRKSFHSMTDELSTIQLQSLIDVHFCDLYNLKEFEMLDFILENGDDGTIPEVAFKQFQYLLEITTGRNVLNDDKSFRSRDTKSLEFCKTIYYESNAKPITGYRYASLYKLANRGRDLIFLNSGQYARDKDIFIHFLEAMDFPDQMSDDEYREALRYRFSYDVLTDATYIRNGYECVLLWDALRILYTLINGKVAEKNSLSPLIQDNLPRGMSALTPKDTYYLITDGSAILRRDFRLLENLDKTVEFQLGFTFEDMMANRGFITLAKMHYQDVTGVQWNGAGVATLDNPAGINIMPISKEMAEELNVPNLRAIVVTDDRNTSQCTKALLNVELAKHDYVIADVELLKSNTITNDIIIRPIISILELSAVIAQYHGLELLPGTEEIILTNEQYNADLELLGNILMFRKPLYDAIARELERSYVLTREVNKLMNGMSIETRTRVNVRS